MSTNNQTNFGEKAVACKYCTAKDLFWSFERDRWMLIESFGLPHSCQEKHEYFKKLAKEKNEELKKEYQKEKERINAIPNDTLCSYCTLGTGTIMPRTCYYCFNFGKINEKVKSKMLYQVRKRLWPDMFNKGDKYGGSR